MMSALAFTIAACAASPTSTPPQTPAAIPASAPAAAPVTLYPTPSRATRIPSPTPSPGAPTVPDSPAPTQTSQPPRPTAPATTASTPTATPYPLPKISLERDGVNVVDYGNTNIEALKPLRFGWLQVFNPPEFPIFGYRVLYRLPLGNAISGKREDIDAWADALEGLARDRKGIINAYTIGNEVNLTREWGGQPPNPTLYTKLLAIAYARIKTADPDALVVSAGLAPTGGTGGDASSAMDDLAYAKAMFDTGALDVMDAYGFHPYGFASPPERDPLEADANGLVFRRAEAHHALLAQAGAGNMPMWATEFGWIIDAKEEGQTCTWPGLDWQRVSRQQQAGYVIRAYDYAHQHWPWMGPMFLWNYDFSRAAQYPDPCEQMKFYSMLDEAGQERPLMQALRTATGR